MPADWARLPDFGVAPQGVDDLAPKGVLTAAINTGNPVIAHVGEDGELAGISVELAGAIARWIDRPLELRTYSSAGAVVACGGEWDIAFLAVDPQREEQFHFTPHYLTVVVDRPGVSIVASTGAAFALHLERTLVDATLSLLPTVADSAKAFLSGQYDALAGIRPALESLADANPGYRVVPGSFLTIKHAMATNRGRSKGAAILDAFVDRAMQSGWIEALHTQKAVPQGGGKTG
jgi:polar amino acid transport system substrate-binding protein